MSESPLAPTVTVLLAVYNGQEFLRGAIDSVLSQTFTDFEFLILDDGSTDQTLPILNEYAKRDARMRIVSRPNKGLTVTLNEGISLARGQYLARMDADDLCKPQRFEKQVAYLQANSDCVMVGSRVMLIDADGEPIRDLCQELTHEEIDSAHLNRGWPVVHPATMMRLTALQQIGGYHEEFKTLQDLDLFLRLAEVGRVANLPDVLLCYRQHFSSVTHTKQAIQMQTREAIYAQMRARRGLPSDAPTTPAAITGPRPRGPREQHQFWAWAALKAGNVHTARKHALMTVKQAPLVLDSWRLLACALRGH